jgi:predicted nucleic acid-binding protein
MLQSMIPMSAEVERGARGLLDTNILIHWPLLDPATLPDSTAICSVTLAELAAAVHGALDAHERARRVDTLQRAEAGFEPIPFDVASARAFGHVAAAVRAAGRSPRARMADLMIAAVAASRDLDLYTTNPSDFAGLDEIVRIVAVPRPESI